MPPQPLTLINNSAVNPNTIYNSVNAVNPKVYPINMMNSNNNSVNTFIYNMPQNINNTPSVTQIQQSSSLQQIIQQPVIQPVKN